MIDSSEISVVVQGAISPATQRVLESVRRFLPKSEIILSTWKGSDIQGLNYDILVENDDPGAMPYNDSKNSRMNNSNRQILSSRNGLKQASREFAMKLRSDTPLNGVGFLHYFVNDELPRIGRYQFFKKRIVCPTRFCRNPRKIPCLFYPSDIYHFGYASDLRSLWDIPLAPEPFTTRYFDDFRRPPIEFFPGATFHSRYFPEQIVFLTFIKKFLPSIDLNHPGDISISNTLISEVAILNNFNIVEEHLLGVDFTSKIWEVPSDIYTRFDWERLINLYHKFPFWAKSTLIIQSRLAYLKVFLKCFPGKIKRLILRIIKRFKK